MQFENWLTERKVAAIGNSDEIAAEPPDAETTEAIPVPKRTV